MQRSIELMDLTFSQWGLEMSLKKTKLMPLHHECSLTEELRIPRGAIEYVERFKHLGNISSKGLSMQPEISARLAEAGNIFHRLNKMWADKHVSVMIIGRNLTPSLLGTQLVPSS